MKKYNLISLLSVFAVLLSLQSCEIAGGLVKFGIWIGLAIAIIVIVVLVRLFSGRK